MTTTQIQACAVLARRLLTTGREQYLTDAVTEACACIGCRMTINDQRAIVARLGAREDYAG